MEYLYVYFSILSVIVIRYFIVAGIPFSIFYKIFPKQFTLNKISEKIARNQDFYREMFYSVQSSMVFALVGFILVATPLREYTSIYKDINSYPIWWMPLSVFIALVIHDAYFYWMHRLLHHPSIYKYSHLVHHKSISPSPWASYSFHISETFLESLIMPIIIIGLPMHPTAIMSFTFASFVINVYGHLGYEIMPRWFRQSFLFEIFNSSVHHNLHHSKFAGNYGLYFRIWDRLMGTENPNYVEEYDRMQEKRFSKNNEILLVK
jgi:lathosterol oxidase